ncbi:MAG TPA: DUF4124 domain-containing protein [Rhodanobacteraceae bacterium]|nr:DUF4124 domain-containing protein [Rhodanobacteraceae bacterium]
MKAAFAVVLMLAFATSCGGARAQVFKCTAANGAVSFQDHACAHGQRQQVINVPSRAPPGYVPPPVATAAPPAASASVSPAPPYVPFPAPLPAMYACVGAVNGKQYLTRSPPPPYLAPLGVMGYPPQSLSQAYGSPGGAGMSAPEGAPKPRIGGPRIATGMTEVQDFCLPATHAQVCGYVQREYDANDHKLRMAMPREQPPFEQREQALQGQLRNCR